MKAVIWWVSKDHGGRTKPPLGVGVPPYSTVVRLMDPPDPWPPELAWSLIVEKNEERSQGNRWVADVRYRVDDAPHGELQPGRRFELYEGWKLVALGQVIKEES